MNSVIVIRHAKSSWDDLSISDFDRTLNEKGKHDAPLMARFLFEKKIPVDSFISSPAKRARKTAAYFAKQFDFETDQIVLEDSLYLAEAEVFYNVIGRQPDNNRHIVLFSHNPGITDFVNTLTSQVRIDDMPTCGIFAVEADIRHWSEFRSAVKNFLFFDAPRNHR